MRIRWRNLELPTKVVADSATRTDSYARFTAEPFERGYGVTVGNGLRRVLLSSIEGSAVTSIKIAGVKHEFSSIDGIKEDVTDMVLAFKRLRVRFHNDDPKVLRIEKKGPGPVTGADIQTTSDCEVVNKDLLICTLTSEQVFDAEIEVRKGRGYVPAEENAREEQEIGVIPIDSIFSPVQRVRYRTESTRVGKLTNYDRLILELWTDGTVTPEQALVEASKIYRKHLNPFIQLFDVGKELMGERSADVILPTIPVLPSTPSVAPSTGAPAAAAASSGGDDYADLRRKIELPIAALDLSVRASNCLEAEGIQTIGEVVARSHDELMNLPNFGRTSLREITRKLEEMGLRLGMDVDEIRGGN
ncbi:MAG: DNA-directed RNA polymerase subunit alpha [Planctomycetes bacterium]|nr:DNA-directed RNA polymerase subunit alpha [Planctomycetota bacterium]MCB9610531.1 DNA-directed RNA polymerase subunit alpha [Polyangiaceae bacterium]MCB9825855.1 DNA-directed RNA polymerase subunit alpha [Planctomycetota bacterium]MCB9829140.1 DNA-directed RNA polymerase subunit alpha [Planctomycetota bacterium]MCB9901254.1 DNA-directed RNA polymerase subunit alpha [Planctomycetota bacterium]